jgi:hypothetical protein
VSVSALSDGTALTLSDGVCGERQSHARPAGVKGTLAALVAFGDP